MAEAETLNNHIDVCVAILEDILHQFYVANFQEEDVLEGLLIACESLTTYCVLLEGVILLNVPQGWHKP